VLFTLIGFAGMYLLLGLLYVLLLSVEAARGPHEEKPEETQPDLIAGLAD
jgi:cytochrome d ubiquinol oxidase subunit I